MTDRELLEKAAKAVGLDLRWQDDKPHIGDWLSRKWWNPLADDGDALRLAVKLKIDIRPSMGGQTKFSYTWKNGSSYGEVSDDPYAATRRAIVRAAALLGEQ